MQIPMEDKTVTTELSGDFTLPDYQPEIKRLLRVSASVLPPSKYISDHEAELAGNIDYYVFYTGSDNRIYCAPLTAEYKIDIPIDRDNMERLDNMNAMAVISPDMISGRVTSPRKLSIKCRLRTRSVIFGDMPVEDGYGVNDGSAEVLYGSADVSRVLMGTGEKLELSDELISDSRDADTRVISAEGRVLVNEVTPMSGAVDCRGDLYLKLLMCRDGGGEPYTASRKIPFSQSVAVEGVGSGCSAAAKGTVSDMNITVDDGRIGVDVGLIIEAEARKKDCVGYVKDAYSTERHTECDYKTVDLWSGGSAFGGNFTLSETKTLDEAGLSAGAKIVDVTGSAYPEEYSFDGGKCTVQGKAKLSLIMEKDGEYSVCDMEVPFRYETKAEPDTSGAIAEAEIVSARARMDGERIGIDAEVGICGNFWGMSEERMLESVSFGDEIERTEGECVICYPMPEDSLWSAAKRYGVTIRSLSENNGISHDVIPDSHDSLSGVGYLII